MNELANVLDHRIEIMLLSVGLFSKKFQKFKVYGQWSNDKISWHIQWVVHLLHGFHRSLDILWAVTQRFWAQEIYKALIVTVSYKFVVWNYKASPGHIEYMNLIANEASELTSGVIFTLFAIMIQSHWLDGRPYTFLT